MLTLWFCGPVAAFLSAQADAEVPRIKPGTVRGRVVFSGDPPRRRRLRGLPENPDCAALHPEAPLSESVIVNEDGTLRNVFVYVKRGLEGRTFPLPTEPVVIDQQGCTYRPHVFGIRVGQALVIRNSDALLHNVHMTSQLNGEWNFGQATQRTESRQEFRIPEIPVRFACDVHSWMEAFAGVVAHPFFAVTGEDGTFTIADLPAGRYTIEAWHEQYGTQEREVELAEDQTLEIEFTFQEE